MPATSTNERRRCALVTGATGGLGWAVVERLAAAGFDVAMNDLSDAVDTERLDGIATQTGARIAYHAADLASPPEIERLVERVTSDFGAIDVLVNNAVVRHFAPVEKFRIEDWDRALAVNLSAPFHTIRLVLPQMRANGWGRIINMSSPFSSKGAPERIDYASTKAGILGLTRTVALEVAGADITCNAIAPGTLPTPAIEARIAAMASERGLSLEDATAAYLSTRQPGGRFISLETVAALVVFLCGPDSREINGANLPVDSAWTVS